MSSVTRNLSMDDLVGGLFGRLSGATGVPRTDSEAAFQEFLKRIPSSSNLAASGLGEPGGSLSSGVPMTGLSTTNGMAAPTANGTNGVNAGAMGGEASAMMRVPSLDFLRHLSASAQQIVGGVPTGQVLKAEGGSGSTPPASE